MDVKDLEYEVTNVPFAIKAEDITDDGIFKGYGSTFVKKPDFGGDVVEYGAFTETIRKGGKFRLGIQMLRMHNRERPLGKYLKIEENQRGLPVVGQLALKTQDGMEAYEFMKMGILNAMSIGWEPLRSDYNGKPVMSSDAISWDDEKGIRYLKKIDLWEISPVLFPMNPTAKITGVKSAIEECKTIREFEHALTEQGLSRSAAKYIAGLCRERFKKDDDAKNPLIEILGCLQKTSADLYISGLVNKATDFQREAEIKIRPRTGESREDFVARCMKDLEDEYPDQDRRHAVCISYWEGK